MDQHRRRHAFSAGQGFGSPYAGFDLEVGDEDPFRIDPTDAHALADLLDPENYLPADVDAEALLEVGLSYLAIEQYEQAVDTLARVCWFTPEDSRLAMEAWVNRGVAYAQLGEYDEAAGAAREALRIDGERGPDDGSVSRFPDLAAIAEVNLAYALWESGDSSRPLSHAERAVELDPRLADAWRDLGFYYNERGLYGFAREALERARSLGLRGVDLNEELARALDELGKPLKAEAVAERAATERAADGPGIRVVTPTREGPAPDVNAPSSERERHGA
jgi:Flp pilus assembly protein TadD